MLLKTSVTLHLHYGAFVFRLEVVSIPVFVTYKRDWNSLEMKREITGCPFVG